MKRTVRVSKLCLNQLKQIRHQFKTGHKSSNICPDWNLTEEFLCDCDTCADLFPKSNITGYCPCHAYKPSYLIKRLTEIINYNERIRDEKV